MGVRFQLPSCDREGWSMMTPVVGLSLPLSVLSPLWMHEGRICPRFFLLYRFFLTTLASRELVSLLSRAWLALRWHLLWHLVPWYSNLPVVSWNRFMGWIQLAQRAIEHAVENIILLGISWNNRWSCDDRSDHLLHFCPFPYRTCHLHPFKHAHYLLCIVNLSRVGVPRIYLFSMMSVEHTYWHTLFFWWNFFAVLGYFYVIHLITEKQGIGVLLLNSWTTYWREIASSHLTAFLVLSLYYYYFYT